MDSSTLRDNGNFWDGYPLDHAKGFLWSEAVGPKHPSRLAAQEFLTAEKAKKGSITILEVPCAAGAEYEGLKAIGDVTCMDRTPIMLEAIKARYPDVKTVQGEIRAIPLKDASFDWVYARAIFEHLPSLEDVKLAMAECYRVAKVGCIFSFFIPPGLTEDIVWNGNFFNNRYALEDIIKTIGGLGAKGCRQETIAADGSYLDDFTIFYVRKV